MSYPPSAAQQSYSSPPPQATPSYYSATPPAPPPKPTSVEERGPPLPPPPPGHAQNEPSELDGGQSYQHRPHYQQPPQQQPNIPPVEPGWLPEGLRDKNTTDLHHLLSTPHLQTALLTNPSTTHPAIPASHSTLQPLLSSNIALSQHLLVLETTLAAKRSATQSRLLALRALEQQHRAKIAETERALEQFSPMALYSRLLGSVGEQEQILRGMEESWLDGEGGVASEREVGEFVRRVKEGMVVRFLRGERRERWDEGRVGGWR